MSKMSTFPGHRETDILDIFDRGMGIFGEVSENSTSDPGEPGAVRPMVLTLSLTS